MKRMMSGALCALALSTACYLDDDADSRQGTVTGAAVATAGSVARIDAGKAAVTLPQPKKKWTVMVYLDGDNNLSRFADDDVAEMMETGSGPDLNVVLLWDNAPSHGEKARHGYYYLTRQGAALLDDVGEVNMGDPRTATEFIDYAADTFPAEKYCWIWWNHGGAVDRAARGVAWDDSSGDHLSEAEQRDIMKHLSGRIGKKIDIVGFDACLMATAEIAVQYADIAAYLVASEQTEPGEGWDYAFLAAVRDRPASSARTVANAILKYYRAWYEREDDVTLSVIYLAHAPAFAAALDAFAGAAMSSGAAGSAFRYPAKGLPMFGEYFDGDRTRYYTKDLHAYLAAVAAAADLPAGARERAAACAAIIRDKKFIPYEWHGTAWNGRAFGLSITLKRATAVYKKLEICRATRWDEFLNWAGFPSNNYKY